MLNFLIIGPITTDINSFANQVYTNIGGSVYYEAFVFENLNVNYTVLTTLKKDDFNLLNKFPDKSKISIVFKDETLVFKNIYITDSNRTQKSNFSNIPITKEDFIKTNINLKDYDAILINPLVNSDLDLNLLKYLSKYQIPILLSLQGILKYPSYNDSIEYNVPLIFNEILKYVDYIFCDDFEFNFIYPNMSQDDIFTIFKSTNISEIIITKNKKGSFVLDTIKNKSYNINPIKPTKIISPTGAGDTYMAAYAYKRFNNCTIEESGNFASKIASLKLEKTDPFNISLGKF